MEHWQFQESQAGDKQAAEDGALTARDVPAVVDRQTRSFPAYKDRAQELAKKIAAGFAAHGEQEAIPCQ